MERLSLIPGNNVKSVLFNRNSVPKTHVPAMSMVPRVVRIVVFVKLSIVASP